MSITLAEYEACILVLETDLPQNWSCILDSHSS
jgi:hypothetical protein